MDIVERLWKMAGGRDVQPEPFTLDWTLITAANEIESLRKRNNELLRQEVIRIGLYDPC